MLQRRNHKKLVFSPEKRSEKSSAALALMQRYSWQRCADETLTSFFTLI